MDNITQKSLTVAVITALMLATGTLDVFAAFVRTNMAGSPDGSCGYGYGYDSGYWYGNGYGPTCPTPPVVSWGGGWGGGAYRAIPWDQPTSTTSSTGSTSTWSITTKTTTSTTSTGSKSITNPYGSNYLSWDDGLRGAESSSSNGSAWDSNISTSTSSNNGSVANTTTITVANPTMGGTQATTPTVVKRTLPATGIK